MNYSSANILAKAGYGVGYPWMKIEMNPLSRPITVIRITRSR
jgi:hypothetical protein